MPAFLHRLPLFAGLAPAACDALEARMTTREFPPQSVIVKQGEEGDAAFVIRSGAVAVRRLDEASGLEFTIREMRDGQMFGEMALLTGRPRTASIVALEQTACALLARRDFERVLFEHPQAAVALTHVLAERLIQAEQQAGRGFVDLARLVVDPRVLTLVPARIIQRHRVLPISFANNRLTLAMVSPGDLPALDAVRQVTEGVMIEPVSISEEHFKAFMSTTYPRLAPATDAAPPPPPPRPAAKTRPAATQPPKGEPARAAAAPAGGKLLNAEAILKLQLADDKAAAAESKQDLTAAADDGPIIQLASTILGGAITRSASDIHIEPMEADVVVRFRIDGELEVQERLPKKAQLGLASRLKLLARLNIAEKRLPQDGRISATIEGKPIDFRVSSVPGKWGEKLCLRILDKSNTALGLDKLIAHAPTLELVREMIRQPYGIIYVTGPTGSGKTTTLYSALAELNEPGVNITTAEDPIEYDLPGVTQIQANAEIDLTFAKILRALLRQDPDVILVGETRDHETAKTAVEAALTGHLVFTTLHTNSAAGAFTRLGELKIEPFMMSSSTVGVIAQRLARRLCQKCREPYKADQTTCRFFNFPSGTMLYRGKGCEACGGQGLRGRVGIYEVLRMTPALRQMVGEGRRSEEISQAAADNGMIDLKGYAAILLVEGQTTVEEVTSVVAVDA